MAQSKCFFNDVKEELECPVCQEQFSEINGPKILKCLHTFCKACLEKLLRRHGGGDIACPLCRRITDCPSNDIGDLGSNLFYKRMVEIVEAYSGKADEGMPPCGNCEKSKPLRFHCFHCNYFLCTDCAEGHKNFKVLRDHRVKEIGQFKSNDYEDFARRGHFCKQHKEELKFYCEQCKICICRDCAILMHREHKFVTFEEALEAKTSEIETKMREVEGNSSRLKFQKKYLEERKAKVNKSVKRAKDEVKRVAEQLINLIREHEANVTATLEERASEVDTAFTRESSSVSEKMMEIERCVKFTDEVLARNNLLEILNVKETLEQRLEELSIPFEPDVQLNYSQVIYISNYTFSSSDALGNLVSTRTEPSLSVAEGIETTKIFQGEEFSFTVTTKDLEGHITYSEMDEIFVEIKCKEKASDSKANITDLKDGRYTVCYKPEAAGEWQVCIKVNGESILGSPILLMAMPSLPPEWPPRFSSSPGKGLCFHLPRRLFYGCPIIKPLF